MEEEKKEQKEKQSTEASESKDLALKKENESEVIPREIMDDLEGLPPEARKRVSQMFSMSMMSGPMPHPIYSKMNTEQVGKVIDNMEKDSVRDHENRISTRRWGLQLWLS